MIFVRVRRNDPEQTITTLDNKSRIGHDDLDPRLRIIPEGHATIDDEPVAGVSVDVQVHPDLARTAERDEVKRIRLAVFRPGPRLQREPAHLLRFRRESRRRPHKSSAGSRWFMTSVGPAISAARPPVAITSISSLRSAVTRFTKPSIRPT